MKLKDGSRAALGMTVAVEPPETTRSLWSIWNGDTSMRKTGAALNSPKCRRKVCFLQSAAARRWVPTVTPPNKVCQSEWMMNNAWRRGDGDRRGRTGPRYVAHDKQSGEWCAENHGVSHWLEKRFIVAISIRSLLNPSLFRVRIYQLSAKAGDEFVLSLCEVPVRTWRISNSVYKPRKCDVLADARTTFNHSFTWTSHQSAY